MKAKTLAQLLMINPEAEVRLNHAHHLDDDVRDIYHDPRTGRVVLTNWLTPVEEKQDDPTEV